MTIEKLKKIIKETDNIVFFGGAGVSTESNIPDFRSNTGLYTTSNNKKYPPEYMLSHTCYQRNTKDFFDFYKSNMIYKDALPNDAHYALAKLEEMGKLKAVITQNIDGLHQMAGSKNVIELHGSIHRNYCEDCNTAFDLDYIIDADNIPKCNICGGTIKPDVVLYEEGLDMNNVENAINYISNADVVIVGGSSLVVYPAAGLLEYYKGDKLILINKTNTQYTKRAILNFNESIGKVLKEIIFI